MSADPPSFVGFHVGVATAGFQIEGGFNGAGEPANNWERWERTAKVEPAGVALDFWRDPEALLDRAASLGCTSFRLSVEWARCEPSEGAVDGEAIRRYRSILQGCRDRGMRPLVTLHHFTTPVWLGEDVWLRLDAPRRFAAWVAVAVDAFGDQCDDWVTINEPNALALHTYVTGMFPPGRRAATGFAIRALDALVTAHVLAYEAIKGRQPDARVATNTYAFTAYELDRLLIDLLLAPSRGITRRELHDHLEDRRREWYRLFPAPTRAERVLRHYTKSTLPLEQAFPRSVVATRELADRGGRALDSVDVDYYDPVTANHLRVPGHRTAGGRNWLPGRMLWDDPPDPAGLARYCEAAAEPGLPLRIVENGICNRVAGGQSFDRLDGWDRPRYLHDNLRAVEDLLDRDVPVVGYWHWTLADNYEWGSYEPRFGIFGVDRTGGAPVIGDLDAQGKDAAGAFRTATRRLVERAREAGR